MSGTGQLKRATVIGAGSFGTAFAVLLARAGLKTTLITRSAEQAQSMSRERINPRYLPNLKLPAELRFGSSRKLLLGRGQVIFLAVPTQELPPVVERLASEGIPSDTGVVSLTKGMMPPDGHLPSVVLADSFGAERVACVGGPAHAGEMVSVGSGLLIASSNQEFAGRLRDALMRGGVVAEISADPVGVELAGVAKNVAVLAAGTALAEGLNAAGVAAARVFAEVWQLAEQLGAQPATFFGLAGVGDLVATALAENSRNRRAGQLLGEGISADLIPAKVGQAVESLGTVKQLDSAMRKAQLSCPATAALASLVAGEITVAQWRSALYNAS